MVTTEEVIESTCKHNGINVHIKHMTLEIQHDSGLQACTLCRWICNNKICSNYDCICKNRESGSKFWK